MRPSDIKYVTLVTQSLSELDIGNWNEQEVVTTALSGDTLNAQEVTLYLEGNPSTASFR